jgi:hypothetical protein
MLGKGLGPWLSRFTYNLNPQFLYKNHISFPLSPAIGISDSDRIRSANYETVLKLRISLGSEPHLFSRSEHSVRKLIDAL